MDRVVPACGAELLQLQAVLLLLLVLRRRVIAVLAITALQRYDFAHKPSFSAVSPQLVLRRRITKRR